MSDTRRTASSQAPPSEVVPPLTPGVETGLVVAVGDGVRVQIGGADPVEVQTVVGLESEMTAGRTVLVVRVAGAPRPVVIGVLAAPGLDSLSRRVDFESAPEAPGRARGTLEKATPVQIEADGRRVEVEASDELVLRCGKASIMLRADGKVTVRGTHIVSQASGPHRLKGGSFSIN